MAFRLSKASHKEIRETWLFRTEVRQNHICNKKAHGYRERFPFFCR